MQGKQVGFHAGYDICEWNNEEKYIVCFAIIYDFTITEQLTL